MEITLKEKKDKKKGFSLNHICLSLFGLIIISIALIFYCKVKESKQEDLQPLSLPINYIWLGNHSMNPEFQNRFNYINYPYNILRDVEWERLGTAFNKFNLKMVHKSDILRLLYIYENGGIYVDTDVVLDYSCLMNLLAEKKGFWMAGQAWNILYPHASNWFLYSSEKKNEKIKDCLKNIQNFLSTLSSDEIQGLDVKLVFEIGGPVRVYQSGAQLANDIYTCTDHLGFGTWKSNS